MQRRRASRGLTLLETTIGATLLVGMLAGANAIITAGTGVAQSTSNMGAASNRADVALQTLAAALRRGSLASIQHLDATNFSFDTTDTGFKVREVKRFSGTAVLSSPATFRFDLPAGKLEGVIVKTQDGIERVIATGVASFTVSRTGNLFTLTLRTRSGPSDDRLRTVNASVDVAARNP